MNNIQIIEPFNLVLAFIPVIVVIVIMMKWLSSKSAKTASYSIVRMLIQLLIVGYVLTAIFLAEHAWIVLIVLLVMVSAGSWIALRTVKTQRKQLLLSSFLAIMLGGGLVLILITQWVLTLSPWYEPRYVIPLAGMIFSTSMNNVSLAIERLNAELENGHTYLDARKHAFEASMIPTVNSMFAVGLVSLPGMMTGQVVSGVSPVLAAQYQIVVMCMVFAAAGLSTVLFLKFSERYFK